MFHIRKGTGLLTFFTIFIVKSVLPLLFIQSEDGLDQRIPIQRHTGFDTVLTAIGAELCHTDCIDIRNLLHFFDFIIAELFIKFSRGKSKHKKSFLCLCRFAVIEITGIVPEIFCFVLQIRDHRIFQCFACLLQFRTDLLDERVHSFLIKRIFSDCGMNHLIFMVSCVRIVLFPA